MPATEPDEELVAIADLTPHPRNYNSHPPEQIEHLAASIREFGFFRNIVIARDGTILSGHGSVEAATTLGYTEVPARRLDLDPESPGALKVLALENEIGRFSVKDDRALSELLREISAESIDGLLGTGYDDMILANLLMVTRGEHEIADFNAAAEWIGMPDYEPEDTPWKLMVSFESAEARNEFLDKYAIRDEITFSHANRQTISARWPAIDAPRNDAGLRWEESA